MNKAQTMLTRVASWGRPPPGKKTFDLDACWSLRDNNTYMVKDPATGPLCSHLDSSPSNGYLCVPIRIANQILGVLHLSFGQWESDYSDDERSHRIDMKQVVITRVTEHYALSLANLRLQETLRIEAIRDPLTNLYNRRYMEDSLKREAQRVSRRGASLGIVMVDIDHFKHVNDTYGHEAGDVVLRELGALLRRHIRSEDIACRYGGEEFLLILPEAPLEVVRHRAEELRVIVKDLLRIQWQGHVLAITLSMGIAAFPRHGYHVKDVVKAADAALYQAKARGRDQVVVAPYD